MTITKLAAFVLASAFAAAAVPVLAQQKPDPTSAPAAAATSTSKADADDTGDLIAAANAAAASNAKAPPSQMVAINKGVVEPTQMARKKAREFGYHEEIYAGKTFFCKDDATVGTRLQTKKCMDAVGFEDYSIQLEFARDTMGKSACNTGIKNPFGPCGGLQ